MHVELIDGPFDGEWLLDPEVPSVWIRRREDGLGYTVDEETAREHYVRTWKGQYMWMGEVFRTDASG